MESSSTQAVTPHTIDLTTQDDDTLNLNCGFAAVVVDKIVGHVDLEKARARNLSKSK